MVASWTAGTAFAGTITLSNGPTSGVTESGGTYSCGGPSVCNLAVAELTAALAAGGVTVAARGASADVVLVNDVTWSSGNRLTLSATRDILLSASIAASNGGGLTLRADAGCTSDGDIVQSGATTITASTIAYSHDGVSPTVVGALNYFKLIDSTVELAALPPTGSFALGCDIIDAGGYVPVPTFSGVLDGLGHAVIDLLVLSGGGVFATLGPDATVTNLVLVRPGVTSSGDDVGALAGIATKSKLADIAVLDATVAGANRVGGIFGSVVGSDVSRVYGSGSVTGATDVGGLVGALDGEAVVLGAAATMRDAMSKMRVNGGNRVGGIVGSVAVNNGLVQATLNSSWSAGAVSGSSQVSGAVGANTSLGPVSDVYWDATTSGVDNDDVAGTTPLTTAQMRQQANFAGFDFGGTWNIRAGISRPFLRSLQSLLDVSVAVSGNSPTTITQAATFNAAVAPRTSHEVPATGSVRFLDGTTLIDAVTLTTGVAAVTTTSLGVGPHTIRAVYGGNAYHLENDGSVSHTVSPGSTTTGLSAAGGPIVATVAPVAPATGTPTGAVTFNVDGANRPPEPLIGPTATLDPSTLGAGLHTVIAAFASDDGRFGPSTSPSIQVTVVGPTTTTMSQTSSTTTLGEAFGLNAEVTSNDGTPTGSVRFIADGARQLAEVGLTDGLAATTVSDLQAGSHIIVAQYLPATSDFTASVSGPLVHDVAKAETTTTLIIADINDGIVTLSIEVARPTSALPFPSGDVAVTIDDVDVGNPTLTDGVATFTSEQLTRGPHTVAARYDGDVNYNASAAAAIAIMVDLEGFRFVASSRGAATFAGGSVPFTLTLTPEAESFTERVTFACESLPPGGSCTFSPAITDVAPVGTVVSLLVNTQRPILASGMVTPQLPPAAWGLLTLVAGALMATRRLRQWRVAWVALVLIMGCGDASNPIPPREGTPPGTYSVTVRARAQTISRVATVEVEVR